jgi:tetratricopeptide (TPR) repeat protein
LREDVVLPRLQYCTFDPDSGTYRSHTFAPELEVTAARSGTTGPGLVADAGTIAPLGHRDRDRHAASDILYIKTELGEGVRLPLWRNTRTACLAFLLAAALVGGGLSLAGRHRARVLADPALQRRRRALRQRSRLRRTLADAGAEELPAVVTEEVMPYLTAVLGLPPGATAADVAGAVRDRCPELADILCEAERSRFRPGEPLRASGRDILGFLGRLSAFAVVLLSLAATAAEAQDLASQLQAEATLAYEQGELDAADARYRDVLENSDRLVHAGVLYNLGNCAYRRGRLGEAVAWYERARRLAPRDTDILENLNFVRGRLELPPVLDPRSPAELITRVRDSLRPDEWLLLLCLTLFVWALGVGVQRFRLRPVPVAVHIGALTVLLVCGAALAGQVTTSYRVRSHGVVVTDRAAPHSLPEATSTPLDLKLAEGESVRIMEERALWVRIRVDDAEAWLPREQVRTVW